MTGSSSSASGTTSSARSRVPRIFESCRQCLLLLLFMTRLMIDDLVDRTMLHRHHIIMGTKKMNRSVNGGKVAVRCTYYNDSQKDVRSDMDIVNILTSGHK